MVSTLTNLPNINNYAAEYQYKNDFRIENSFTNSWVGPDLLHVILKRVGFRIMC